MGEVLNKKEMNQIVSVLHDQFGVSDLGDFILIKSSKEKFWLTKKDVLHVDFSKMRVETIGFYFGKMEKQGIRLSIEGSQIVGKKARKNIIDINEKQLFLWLRGFDLNIKCESDYVLLRHGNDFVGCGKRKIDGILNFIPKDRRIRSLKDKELKTTDYDE